MILVQGLPKNISPYFMIDWGSAERFDRENLKKIARHQYFSNTIHLAGLLFHEVLFIINWINYGTYKFDVI